MNSESTTPQVQGIPQPRNIAAAAEQHSRYTIDTPAFAGPLDLLLHLIDRDELDITAISLSKVTEQYLSQIEQLKEHRMEQLIDFLVIGARLVLIKSRALLPHVPEALGEGEEEEDPAQALIRQLHQYRRFKQAALWLHEREEHGLRTYLRVAPPIKPQGQLDMSGVSLDSLMDAVRAAMRRADDLQDSVSLVRPRRITIQGQIERLRHRVRGGSKLRFEELLSSYSSRLEIAVTLLAVLELIKRREVTAVQDTMFGPIELRGLQKE